jgi:uncharacterized protein (TIGR03905 family)
MEIYKTKGTCSREIRFQVEKDIIMDVKIIGACPGSLAGVSNLVKGKKVDDVIESLKGTPCGGKKTSCPDQLAQALIAYKNSH